jgi:hypothetical protein
VSWTHHRKTTALTFALFTALLALPTESHAQRRIVRGGIRAVPGRVVVMRAYYAPQFYDPWLHPYTYGWYPPYAYGFAGQPDSSLRLQVEPRETEVFVDGYYAGTVDDFDGFFQRLHLEPGEHEITLYLAGNRTARHTIYLQPGRTFRVRHTMEPLAPGETPEPRPASTSPQRRGPAPPLRPDSSPQPARESDAGSVAIRVQPAGAEIVIDGERWEGPAAGEQLVVQVAAGTHRIEVRLDGYRTYASDVEVRRGDTATLNVSLSRQ